MMAKKKKIRYMKLQRKEWHWGGKIGGGGQKLVFSMLDSKRKSNRIKKYLLESFTKIRQSKKQFLKRHPPPHLVKKIRYWKRKYLKSSEFAIK